MSEIINLNTMKRQEPFVDNRFPKDINPQLYFFVSDDGIFAYSPFFNSSIKINEKEYEFLTNNRRLDGPSIPEKYSNLLNSFFYMSTEIVNAFNKRNKEVDVLHMGNTRKATTITIMVASICNLRCKYCYVYGGEPEKLKGEKKVEEINYVVDTEMAANVIDQLNPEHIRFLGWGEPTLALGQIKQIVGHVKGKNIVLDIVTNAVYGNKREEIVKYLVENNVRMQISYDGLPDMNDEYRITSEGKGSSEEILKTIEEIKKYKPLKYAASVRVTVCKGMESRIKESLVYLVGLGFDKIRFEPLLNTGRAKSLELAEPNLEEMAISVADAAVYAKMYKINFSSNLLPSANVTTMSCKTCGYVTGEDIALGPDGKFYSCVDPLQEFCIGHVKKDNDDYVADIDYNKRSEFIEKRSVFNLKNCQNCPVKCGGGCTKESFNKYGNLDSGGENEEMCNAKRLALMKYIEFMQQIHTVS